MKKTHFRGNLRNFGLGIVAGCAFSAPAALIHAEDPPTDSDSGDPDSVIDWIIDWIEDWFDGEPPEEEPPADGESW